jgi:hypothetical protein
LRNRVSRNDYGAAGANETSGKVLNMYADGEAPERRSRGVGTKQKKAGKQAGEKSGFRKVCESHQ